HPIAHFPHRDTRAPQRSRNLPNATAFLQPSLNFFISIHRELPPRHCDPSPRSRKTANGTGPNRSSKRLAQVGPIRGNRVGPISGNQVVPILGNRVGPIRGNFAGGFPTRLKSRRGKANSPSLELVLPRDSFCPRS